MTGLEEEREYFIVAHSIINIIEPPIRGDAWTERERQRKGRAWKERKLGKHQRKRGMFRDLFEVVIIIP